MKKLLLVCFILVSVLSSYGQIFSAFQIDAKQGKPGHPASSQTTITAQFTTSITDIVQLAKMTSDYFNQDSLLEFIQWDEIQGQNIAHYLLRRCQYKTQCMGLQFVRNPVKLHFDIDFQFVGDYMEMTFKGFTSEVYAFADENKNLYIGSPDENLTQTDQKILDEWQNSLFDLTTNYNKEARNQLRQDMESRVKLYDEGMRSGHTQLITLDNMSQYKRKGFEKFWNNTIEMHKNNHWILGVDENCFDNYFKLIFYSYFNEIAELINGELIGVEENAILKYERDDDGKIRPVDPKLKKQWIKDGISF